MAGTITRQQAMDRIYASKGERFFAAFWKRTDGSYRAGIFQHGGENYSAALKGGRKAYDHKAYGLIPVFDFTKMEMRSIPVEGLELIAFGDGPTLKISDSPDNPL